MTSVGQRHARCFVVGCKNQHKSLYRTPASEVLRAEWIKFIYDGKVPATVNKHLYVCAHHFEPFYFHNLGQYKVGLSRKLFIREQAIPTIRGETQEDVKQVCIPVSLSSPDQGSSVYPVITSVLSLNPAQSALRDMPRDVACQTDPPKKCHVGTQLSMKTLRSHVRSRATQARVPHTEIGVGTTSEPLTASQRPSKRPRLEMEEGEVEVEVEVEEVEEEEQQEEEEQEEEEEESSLSMDKEEAMDATYDPADSVTSSETESDILMEESIPVHKTPTYIVYESCLLELFETCPVCKRPSDVQPRRIGTFFSVEQKCEHCQYSRKWNSQPMLENTPAGNLQLSAAVYATGASFFKVEKIFRAMQLKMFHYDTFRRHCRAYIEPAIVHKWKTAQDQMLEQLTQESNVVLRGAMRVDLIGYSDKVGSYAIMDMNSSTIVDLQLVQSNEVGGGDNMEKEGLKRSLSLLEASGVTVDSIVTDCDSQVQEFLSEAIVTHYCDVRHMEKRLSKELDKVSHDNDCDELKNWLPALKKHIYWTASTSTSGPERVAKWTSILNHVQDIHTHKSPHFPQCAHVPHTSGDQSGWLTAGTPALCSLEKVLTAKKVLKEVERLSPHNQTSLQEVFHKVSLRFVPKDVIFPFVGMLCRFYLAALHFNENVGRPQAASTTNGPPSTNNYVDELLDLLFEKVFPDPAPYADELLKIPVPEDGTAREAGSVSDQHVEGQSSTDLNLS